MNQAAAQQSHHDQTAERALIGALIVGSNNRTLVAEAQATVDEHDFFFESNRQLFRAWLYTDGGDSVQLNRWLRDAGEDVYKSSGGGGYIAQVSASTPTSANWKHYHGIVREQRKRREMQTALRNALFKLDAHGDLEEVAEIAGSGVARVMQSRATDATWKWDRALTELVSRAERAIEARKAGGDSAGWTWGDAVIDACGARVLNGQLTVIGARAKSGKTDLVLQGAISTALAGSGVLVVTLEMLREACTARALAKIGGPPELAVMSGDITESQFIALRGAIVASKDCPLYVSNPGLRWSNIVREIRAQKAMHPEISTVVVDYLQLVQLGRRAQSEDAVGQVAVELAGLTRELDVAGVLLSQLNRNAKNDNRPPRKEDLRQSGQIEEAADRIVLLDRPNQDKSFDDYTRLRIDGERWGAAGEGVDLMMNSTRRLTPVSRRSDEDAYRGWRQ